MGGDGDGATVGEGRPRIPQESVERLVLRYREGLRRMCWSYLHDRDMVEDVLQETFCRIVEQIGGLPVDADPGAWIHRVAANLCIDELRRRSRRSRALIPGAVAEVAMLSVPDADRGGHPDEALDMDLTRRLVRDAILAVPARQREVLVLRDVMGHSEGETAAALAITSASVQGLLHRARERFREAYVERASEGALPAACGEATFVLEHLRLEAMRKDRLRVIERHLACCTRCRERFRPQAAPKDAATASAA